MQNLVPIFIMGKRYLVPDSLTIQKAMEYAGYQLIRGCGCRGGATGQDRQQRNQVQPEHPSSSRHTVLLSCYYTKP